MPPHKDTPLPTRGPEWKGLEPILSPSPITWDQDKDHNTFDCLIAGMRVAFITKRPHYCDRGHWSMQCELPDLDGADSFPRYYMNFETARAETEAFLKWRLWRIRDAQADSCPQSPRRQPKGYVSHKRTAVRG